MYVHFLVPSLVGLCLVGSRLTHIHLLSGGILPLLSLLEATLSRNASKLELPRDARTLRVVRVQLDEGQRIIGVRYPLPLIYEVELMLGTLSRAQSSEVSNSQCLFPFLPIMSLTGIIVQSAIAL